MQISQTNPACISQVSDWRDFHISPQTSINHMQKNFHFKRPKILESVLPLIKLETPFFFRSKFKNRCVWSCHVEVAVGTWSLTFGTLKATRPDTNTSFSFEGEENVFFFLHRTECQETKGRYRAEIDKKGIVIIICCYKDSLAFVFLCVAQNHYFHMFCV